MWHLLFVLSIITEPVVEKNLWPFYIHVSGETFKILHTIQLNWGKLRKTSSATVGHTTTPLTWCPTGKFSVLCEHYPQLPDQNQLEKFFSQIGPTGNRKRNFRVVTARQRRSSKLNLQLLEYQNTPLSLTKWTLFRLARLYVYVLFQLLTTNSYTRNLL